MTTDELIIKLESFNETLPEVRDKLILDAVFSSAALAKRRVIGNKENQDGAIFGIYSPEYLKRRIKKGKGPDPRINFSFTGKMWQSTKPVITSSTPDEVRIRISPLDPQRNKVMGYHDKKYNEIMSLSDEEVNQILEDFNAGIQDFIDGTIHN